MISEIWLVPIAILVCLLLSAFFSGSETALTASSRAGMLRLEKHGNRRAAIVNRLLRARERLIGALLLGNNAVNIAASSLATGLLLSWFGDLGVIFATIVMTIVVVVFSEVLALRTSRALAERLIEQAVREKRHLRDVARADAEATRLVKPADIDALFEPAASYGAASGMTQDVLSDWATARESAL